MATIKSTHYFFGGDKPTTFSLFAERRSGYPISAVFETQTKSVGSYQTQAFGFDDGLQDDDANFLAYVPNGIADPLVCWVSCAAPDMAFAADAMRVIAALDLALVLLPKVLLKLRGILKWISRSLRYFLALELKMSLLLLLVFKIS